MELNDDINVQGPVVGNQLLRVLSTELLGGKYLKNRVRVKEKAGGGGEKCSRLA